MGFFDRITTRHTFPDGAKASIVHRQCLKVQVGERFVEIGFEQAFEPGVRRLIHADSIRVWKTRDGDEPVTPTERSEIVRRVAEYCRVKGMTYRVVGPSALP